MICCQQLRNTLNQIFHEENSSDLYPQFCGTTGLYFVLGLVIFVPRIQDTNLGFPLFLRRAYLETNRRMRIMYAKRSREIIAFLTRFPKSEPYDNQKTKTEENYER